MGRTNDMAQAAVTVADNAVAHTLARWVIMRMRCLGLLSTNLKGATKDPAAPTMATMKAAVSRSVFEYANIFHNK